MAQHGQPWQKTQKWGTVQVNVQGPQPGYIRATITNNDDDTLDVHLYIDGALKLSALSRPPGSTFTSDPISVQGNTQHTVTIKWRDPDTSQEYSKSVNVYVPQGQTVTATLTIDLHTAGSPKLEITHNFPSQVTSGITFSVTVTVRNSGTADATNVASGISWSGDAFSSLGCTGTWKKDRLAPGEAMQYTCSLKAGKPGTYTVEVSAVADSGVSTKSTIQVVVMEAKDTTPPSVKVLAPAGGEVLTPGSTFRIKWQATDNVAVAKISIYLYQASGLASVIASNIQNTGYYDWTVPDNPGSYYIRIVAVDTSGNTGTADSPQFVIAQIQQKQPPILALNNPQINGLTVTISGTATPGYLGATITSIHWEWGDGKSEDTWLPATHTYTSPGTYTVTVTAYQSDGLTTTKTITVTLQATNKPPVADFLYSPLNPVAGDRISFTDKSYDPDGRIASWLWDFGDGVSSHERNPTHIYSSPGIYMVTLTVKDDKGVEAVARKFIYVGEKRARVEIKIDQNRINTQDLGSATKVTIPFTLTNKDSFTRHVYICVKGGGSIYTRNVECLSSKEYILAPNEMREDKIDSLVLNDPTQRIAGLIVEVKDFYNHLTISSDYATFLVGDCGLPPNAEIELPSPAQKALKLIVLTDPFGCVVKVHKAYRVQLTVDNPSKLSFNYLELRYSKPLPEKVLICTIDQVNPIPTDLQGAVEKILEKLLEKYAPALLPVLKPIAALEYVKCIIGPDKILPVELQTKEVLIPGSGEFYLVAYNTEGNNLKIVGVSQKLRFDVWDDMPLKNINVKIMPALDILIPSKISSVYGQNTEFSITIVNNSPDYLSGNIPQFIYDQSSLSILPKNQNIDLMVWHLSPGQSIIYTFVLNPLKNGTHKVKISVGDSLGQIQIVEKEMEVDVYSPKDIIKDTTVKVSPNKIKPGDTFDVNVSFNVDFSIISSLHNIAFVPVGVSVKPVEVKVELFEEKAMLWLFDRKIAEKSIQVDSTNPVASKDVFFNLHGYDLGWLIFRDGEHRLYARITLKYCVGELTCIYGSGNNWGTIVVETPRVTVSVKS
jgi:PKD repeat protein